ncbi:MAG: hypothetical protein KDE26_23315, partial [Bacteroidetes bacterium]|nr:hypothetical protein [Bacteroidota bacterium]
IESEWKVEQGKTVYHITVPPNTTAKLELPAESLKQIKESGKKIKKAKGVTFQTQENERLVFELTSGEYQFEVIN